MNLQFEIITPEKVVYNEEVEEIIVPTTQGEITILPRHLNLLTKVKAGEITVIKEKKTQVLAVTGGFIEVVNNKVTLLADYAVRSEDIDASKALEAQKRAEHLMQQTKEKANQKDFAIAESELRKAILELKVVNKRKALRNLPSSQ